MALRYLQAKLSIIPSAFHPTTSAIFSLIPFTQRWRTLLLQPLHFLAILITSPNWLFNNRYSVIYIPTRSGPKRCLIYEPPSPKPKSKSSTSSPPPRPLHISLHGGGFIGGIPEQDARFNAYISDRTGAVVVSPVYRLSPRHAFPSAHDDIDDIFTWLITHAPTKLHISPSLITVSGSSVGGNLALTSAVKLHRQNQLKGQTSDQVTIKAYIGLCPVVDFRLPPWEKPVPPKFPKRDPLAFMMPLYDAYPGPGRVENFANERLHPTLSRKEDLPERVLLVIAGIDVLRDEQERFVERLEGEVVGETVDGDEDQGGWRGVRKVKGLVVEEGFHGWLELPKSILEKERLLAFDGAVETIRDAHRQYGWTWEFGEEVDGKGVGKARRQ